MCRYRSKNSEVIFVIVLVLIVFSLSSCNAGNDPAGSTPGFTDFHTILGALLSASISFFLLIVSPTPKSLELDKKTPIFFLRPLILIFSVVVIFFVVYLIENRTYPFIAIFLTFFVGYDHKNWVIFVIFTGLAAIACVVLYKRMDKRYFSIEKIVEYYHKFTEKLAHGKPIYLIDEDLDFVGSIFSKKDEGCRKRIIDNEFDSEVCQKCIEENCVIKNKQYRQLYEVIRYKTCKLNVLCKKPISDLQFHKFPSGDLDSDTRYALTIGKLLRDFGKKIEIKHDIACAKLIPCHFFGSARKALRILSVSGAKEAHSDMRKCCQSQNGFCHTLEVPCHDLPIRARIITTYDDIQKICLHWKIDSDKFEPPKEYAGTDPGGKTILSLFMMLWYRSVKLTIDKDSLRIKYEDHFGISGGASA